MKTNSIKIWVFFFIMSVSLGLFSVDWYHLNHSSTLDATISNTAAVITLHTYMLFVNLATICERGGRSVKAAGIETPGGSKSEAQQDKKTTVT